MKDSLRETDLVMPGLTAPSNLRRGGRFRTAQITSDIYNVCLRLAELSPRLTLHWVEDTLAKDYKARDTIAFVVVETDETGFESVVLKTRELSPQIVNDVRYFMGVPLEKRFAELEKWEAKREAQQKEDELDALYEKFGGDMLRQLYHDGFVHGAKPGANLPFRKPKRMT